MEDDDGGAEVHYHQPQHASEEDLYSQVTNEDDLKQLWEQAENDVSIAKQITKAAKQRQKHKLRSKWDDDEEDADDDFYLGAKTFKSLQTSVEDSRDLALMVHNEMAAPDLQPYRLFENLKEKSREQMEKAFSGDSDVMEKAIYEMDSNRTDFELVALNRLRLQKIAKYATYFLRNQLDRMSSEEIEFAQAYVSLRKDHLGEAFLNKLPSTFQELEYEDDANQEEIYPKPNLRSFVIFRAIKDLGQIYPGEIVLKDQTYACPYSLIQEHVLAGNVKLI